MIHAMLMSLTWMNQTEALYLDPTTGSIAYQVAIGGLLVASTAVKMYWRRVKGSLLQVFRRTRSVK